MNQMHRDFGAFRAKLLAVIGLAATLERREEPTIASITEAILAGPTPVAMPAVAPNAFPAAFGDFKEGYLITDRVGMRITRDEITTPGFVKFYVRKRVGGKLRNTQAIKLLKIAAS